MDENFDFDTVELERYRVAILTELATHFAEPARVDFQQHARFAADSIMARVEQAVWGEEAGVLRIETPATWWEMLKRDHAPAWFVRRWPVRYTVQEYQARTLYPKMNFPGHAHVAHVFVPRRP